MKKKIQNIAVICARSGSKRIPDKNIKIFFGKPIIYYSIKAAKKCKIFDKIIVNTNSNKIAKIALKCGAEVPFIRSKKLAKDDIQINEVMSSTAFWLSENYMGLRNICCIYPASPLISHKSIISGYKKFLSGKWEYVFAASKYAHNINRAIKIDQNKRVSMLHPRNYLLKSQDFEDAYFDAAQFYWGSVDTWKMKKKCFTKKSTFIELSNLMAHDLDTKEDWVHIKKLFQINKKL